MIETEVGRSLELAWTTSEESLANINSKSLYAIFFYVKEQ